MIAVRGPRPLRVAWLNGAALALPQMPPAGAELTAATGAAAEAAVREIEALLVGDVAPARVIEHADWTGAAQQQCSLVWRVPAELTEEPLVILAQLQPGEAVSPDAATPGHSQWLAASAAARRVLQSERGVATAQQALARVANGTGAVDAFLATCQRGELRTATSVRGLLAARVTRLGEEPELIRAVRSAGCSWLTERARGAVGVPPGVQASPCRWPPGARASAWRCWPMQSGDSSRRVPTSCSSASPRSCRQPAARPPGGARGRRPERAVAPGMQEHRTHGEVVWTAYHEGVRIPEGAVQSRSSSSPRSITPAPSRSSGSRRVLACRMT